MLKLDDGTIHSQCAIDPRKAASAFGSAGESIAALAETLCAALAHHWASQPAEAWVPPFEGAALERVARVGAKSLDSAFGYALGQNSSLHRLLAHYEIPASRTGKGIVEKVRQAVKRDHNAAHLAPRFNRVLNLGQGVPPMQVDFLGRNYACFIVEATTHSKYASTSAERALGKLVELQALKRFVKRPKASLGLLEEERPERFELLLVGDQTHPVQRSVIAQIRALADKGSVRAEPWANPAATAAHVVQMERFTA